PPPPPARRTPWRPRGRRPPFARMRENENGGSLRPASTRCEPGGMSSARTSINSIERGSCKRWTSSSTRRNGSDVLARTLPSRGRRMLARSACDTASAEKVRRSSASTESRASATYARSADGSWSSSVTSPATTPEWPLEAREVKGRAALERELSVRLLRRKQLELLEQ